MLEYLSAYLSLFFIFAMTVSGASMLFFVKKVNGGKAGRAILGFSVGVMIATAVFALLVPAMESVNGFSDAVMIVFGFAFGCIVLIAMDVFMKKKRENNSDAALMLAMTLHNIPEGITVGVAFSLFIENPDNIDLLPGALILALGIGIQNFPESMALAALFVNNGMKGKKAFLLASLSGVVEPIFGICALYVYDIVKPFMPFMLSYAAGTMLHITVEELIPDLQCESKGHIATVGIMSGILIMLAMELV